MSGRAPTIRGGRSGATLIEILVATLLLAVLAVAGGAHLYHARAMVGMQRNRLIAAELAAERLEIIRMCRPVEIQPPGTGVYFMAQSGTNWVFSAADPGETASLNNRAYPIRSTVQWVYTPGLDSNRCLRVDVTADYRTESGESVRMTSLVTP